MKAGIQSTLLAMIVRLIAVVAVLSAVSFACANPVPLHGRFEQAFDAPGVASFTAFKALLTSPSGRTQAQAGFGIAKPWHIALDFPGSTSMKHLIGFFEIGRAHV